VLEAPTEEDIRSKLGKLPIGLEKAYDEIYKDIAGHKHARIFFDRACMWVMSTFRPLRSEELLAAIRVDPDKDTIDLTDDITEMSLSAWCKHLLVVDSQRKVWRFSHLSVLEYFERNHWCLGQLHSNAAKVCLSLLVGTHKILRSPQSMGTPEAKHDSVLQDILDPVHPLQNYAQNFWVMHIRTYEQQLEIEREDVDHTLSRMLKSFLGSFEESSIHYRKWYRRIVSGKGRLRGYNSEIIRVEELLPENVAIFVACRFSVYHLLEDWWNEMEFTASRTNKLGESLLALASVAGCKPICERLTNMGLSVNSRFKGLDYGSVLAAAASRGNAEVVRFLVEQGADVNASLSSGKYGNALAAAAVSGDKETVKILIEHGAQVNLTLTSGNYGSALVAAVVKGEVSIVQCLYKQGADVNATLSIGRYGSALAAAAVRGGKDLVETLLDQGANVNMPLSSGDYGSALAAAAEWGNISIVKLLVDQGADVNMALPHGDYDSALAAAKEWGNTEIIEFLINQGAQG
jgi:ankyrin repeat domain-containing protein 50